MKKKVMKIILVIILLLIIVLIAFLGNTFRKYLIIKDLQEKYTEYYSSENYYMKETNTYGETSSSIIESYIKGEKKFVTMLVTNSDGESTEYVYTNGEIWNIYYEDDERKQAFVDVEEVIIANMYNYLESESNLETFRAALWTHIEKVDYNNTECYKISNYLTSSQMGGVDINETYVEIETGLCLKHIMDNDTNEYEYEFDNVTDEDVAEPDISEYMIVDNSNEE